LAEIAMEVAEGEDLHVRQSATGRARAEFRRGEPRGLRGSK
jgi:hypothetical protein